MNLYLLQISIVILHSNSYLYDKFLSQDQMREEKNILLDSGGVAIIGNIVDNDVDVVIVEVPSHRRIF